MSPEGRKMLVNQLTRDEGLRLKPYRDTVGKLSLGIGRNLDDVGISRVEAEFLLENDITTAQYELFKALPWVQSLSEPRQRVLINMAFNMGLTSLLGFKQTLAHIQAGRWTDAASGMLASKWASQVGVRAERLAITMETGVDQ